MKRWLGVDDVNDEDNDAERKNMEKKIEKNIYSKSDNNLWESFFPTKLFVFSLCFRLPLLYEWHLTDEISNIQS